MAEDGRLARVARAPADEPSLSDLLDPIALEERLREARLRRAEALARRPEPPAADAPAPSPPTPPEPAAPEPAAPGPIVLTAPPRAVPAPAPPRTGAALPLLIFLAGLGLGGAAVAVLALQTLPERIGPAAEVAPAPAPSASRSVAPLPEAAPEAPAAAAPVVAAAPSPPPEPVDSVAPEAPPPAAAPDLPDPARLAAPAAEETPPAAAGAEAALAAAAPEPAPEPEPAAAPALPARVLVHYPASAAESAAEARDALRAAGVPEVEIIPARYAIGRSNIRYYHAGDRAPAAALAPLVARALDGEAPEARDFTDYPTPAAAGTIEIWLAGAPRAEAPRAASRAPARSAPATTPMRSTPAAAPEPYQIPGVIAPAPSRAEQVERILLERLRQGR